MPPPPLENSLPTNGLTPGKYPAGLLVMVTSDPNVTYRLSSSSSFRSRITDCQIELVVLLEHIDIHLYPDCFYSVNLLHNDNMCVRRRSREEVVTSDI
jgi:hypothetical protein